MKLLTPEEEAELLCQGEKPYQPPFFHGSSSHVVTKPDGTPTGETCRVYRVNEATGIAEFYAPGESLTPEEMDAVLMRDPTGHSVAITYGEYRQSLCPNIPRAS